MVQNSHDVELRTYSPGVQEAQFILSADEVLPPGLVVVGYRQSVRGTAQMGKNIFHGTDEGGLWLWPLGKVLTRPHNLRYRRDTERL